MSRSQDTEALLAEWNECGYYRLIGMEVTRADAAGSEFRIEVGEQHLQAYGTAHGGILGGLLDAAMGLAILGRIPRGEGCATVEMKVNFTAPAPEGPLAARGWVISEGRRLIVAGAEAVSAAEVMVACGQGTFARIPAQVDQ